MMFGYMTLPDETEAAHSELRPDGTVKVYFIWITKSGKALISNNNSQISSIELRKLL